METLSTAPLCADLKLFSAQVVVLQ